MTIESLKKSAEKLEEIRKMTPEAAYSAGEKDAEIEPGIFFVTIFLGAIMGIAATLAAVVHR